MLSMRNALLGALCVVLLPFAASAQKITFLTPSWGVPPDKSLLESFQRDSGITVEIQSVQNKDLFSRVQVAAATGQAAADVIFLTEEAPSNVVATNVMRALNDLAAKDPLEADLRGQEFWRVDGELYGIPVYSQLVMMDYNQARLQQAGFNAPPKTWAELKRMAEQLKSKGIDKHPIAMKASDWSWYLIALSMGDPMFDDELNPVFADSGSKARQAMSLLLEFFSEELISPEIVAGTVNQHSIFWSGSGTFHQGWQGSIRVGNNPERSKQAPNVAYMVLPEAGNTWSFPAAIGIAENSKNAEAAWKFIRWYTGAANQKSIYNAFGLYPSRTSVAAELNGEGAIAGYGEIVAQADRVNELPRYTLWWGPFTAKVSETILTAVQTGMSADQTVDQLAEIWNDLKSEYE
jgi:multiple sugar transport system substrate-binding protein